MYFGVRIESGFSPCLSLTIAYSGSGLLRPAHTLWIEALASGANRIGRLPVGAKQLGEFAEC